MKYRKHREIKLSH